MTLIAESGVLAHLADSVFTRQKQLGGTVEPIDAQQVVGRNAGEHLDLAVEVCTRESKLPAEHIDIEVTIVETAVDIGIEFLKELLVER